MKTEITPQNSDRAEAFRMWMESPMPMVTLVKTFDVSRAVKISRRTGFKLNMLLCWCIGKAASGIKEFYILPERLPADDYGRWPKGEAMQGKLFRYDELAVNVIVENSRGGICSCDIPYADDLQQFNQDYLRLTTQAAHECESSFLEDHMIIGTSTLIQTELDCIVNQYSDKFNNPFLAWAKYRKGLFKTTLPVSFQFHHVQMDGVHAARFMADLQAQINRL